MPVRVVRRVVGVGVGVGVRASTSRSSSCCRRSLLPLPGGGNRRIRTACSGGSEPPTGTTTTTSEASEKVRVAFRELYPPNSNQTVKYGVLKADVDVAAIPDESTQAKLREEAAKSLTNINADERERRKQIGTYVLAATAVAAVAMLATHASPSTRATIALPLFFGSGFYLSGVFGL